MEVSGGGWCAAPFGLGRSSRVVDLAKQVVGRDAPGGHRREGTRSAAQGRMQEQAALPTFPKRKVGRRKGGRGKQQRHSKWISSQPQHPTQPKNPGIP